MEHETPHGQAPSNNIIGRLVLLIRARLKKMRRFIKMCLCGLSGMAVQIILFNILRFHLHEAPANSIAIECAILTNFFMHNTISFRDVKLSRDHKLRTWIYKLGKFNLFSLFSLLLQTLVMYLGVTFFGSSFWKANAFLIVGIGLGTISNYFTYKHFVWKVA